MTAVTESSLRPLSALQSGVWAAQMLAAEGTVFNFGQYYEIPGAVDPRLLKAALRRVVEGSDALHLRILETGDGPRQAIGDVPDWSMPLIDVSAAPDPRAAAEAWMRDDVWRAVDLARGPLFGFAVFRAAPDRFFWYARYHQLCNDGVGVSLVARRVAARYSALAEGGGAEARLPASPGRAAESESPGSWLDLLADEERYRLSDRYERDREYWRRQLADRPAPVTLSGRHGVLPRRPIRRTGRLPRPVAEALRALGRAQGGSLAMVLVAAAALYLRSCTGARDVVLGMPVSARVGPRMRGIAGPCGNLLPLRLTLDPGVDLGDFLRQTSWRIRQVLGHQRYRFEDLRSDLGLGLVEQLHGIRVNVFAPRSELLFAGHPARGHSLSAGPVDDLAVAATDFADGSGLRIHLDANPAHYSAGTLVAHHRRFLALLVRMAAEPGARLSRFLRLEAAERRPGSQRQNDGEVDRAAPGRRAPQVVEGPLPAGEHRAPETPLQKQLHDLWCEILGVDRAGIDDDFFGLGGQSLQAVRVLTRLEETFGYRLPQTAFIESPTIAGLAAWLSRDAASAQHRRTSPASSLLIPLQPAGTRRPLFLIHTLHGSVLRYVPLAQRLGPDQPVYGVQAPGLEEDAFPFTRVEEMTERYLEEIRSFQGEGPYQLGGYCFGGLIALEIARQLREQDEQVSLLVLVALDLRGLLALAAREPGSRSRRAGTWTARFWDRHVRHHRDRLAGLTPSEALGYLSRRLRWRFGDLRLKIAHRPMRQISRVTKHYVPRFPYPGRIIYFRESETTSTYRAANRPPLDPDALATGGLEIHDVPGDHDEMLLEPHVGVVAERLRDCLERARGMTPSPSTVGLGREAAPKALTPRAGAPPPGRPAL